MSLQNIKTIHCWYCKTLEFSNNVFNVVDIDYKKMCKYRLVALATLWKIHFKKPLNSIDIVFMIFIEQPTLKNAPSICENTWLLNKKNIQLNK